MTHWLDLFQLQLGSRGRQVGVVSSLLAEIEEHGFVLGDHRRVSRETTRPFGTLQRIDGKCRRLTEQRKIVPQRPRSSSGANNGWLQAAQA